jgi:hypothetical protein
MRAGTISPYSFSHTCRLGHWIIRIVSRALTGGYPSRNISLDGWISGYTRITHTKKVQVPLNAVSIPSRIRLDGYPENPSMDYPDVSIPVPKSAHMSEWLDDRRLVQQKSLNSK